MYPDTLSPGAHLLPTLLSGRLVTPWDPAGDLVESGVSRLLFRNPAVRPASAGGTEPVPVRRL